MNTTTHTHCTVYICGAGVIPTPRPLTLPVWLVVNCICAGAGWFGSVRLRWDCAPYVLPPDVERYVYAFATTFYGICPYLPRVAAPPPLTAWLFWLLYCYLYLLLLLFALPPLFCTCSHFGLTTKHAFCLFALPYPAGPCLPPLVGYICGFPHSCPDMPLLPSPCCTLLLCAVICWWDILPCCCIYLVGLLPYLLPFLFILLLFILVPTPPSLGWLLPCTPHFYTPCDCLTPQFLPLPSPHCGGLLVLGGRDGTMDLPLPYLVTRFGLYLPDPFPITLPLRS